MDKNQIKYTQWWWFPKCPGNKRDIWWPNRRDAWHNFEMNALAFSLLALRFSVKWVTKATSGCFAFPKQRARHECHFYLCSYQPWTGGHRLPFRVPATTASFRNLGPPLTIVLSYRKYGSLLTPSIHWVSCVRLPRPVFIFLAFLSVSTL